eukprot:941450-Heterocapsa_arctica.AAC.1
MQHDLPGRLLRVPMLRLCGQRFGNGLPVSRVLTAVRECTDGRRLLAHRRAFPDGSVLRPRRKQEQHLRWPEPV